MRSKPFFHDNRESPMLVLSRKLGEKIVIGDNIVITVVKIDRNQIRIGIEAPQKVPVYREEIAPLRTEEAGLSRKLRSNGRRTDDRGPNDRPAEDRGSPLPGQIDCIAASVRLAAASGSSPTSDAHTPSGSALTGPSYPLRARCSSSALVSPRPVSPGKARS